MQIICGGRGSGKTKKLIKYCLDNDVSILCSTKEQEDLIKEKSRIYFNQLVKTVLKDNLDKVDCDRIAIDEFDDYINKLFKDMFGYNGKVEIITVVEEAK